MSKTFHSGIQTNSARNKRSRKITRRQSKKAYKGKEVANGNAYKRFYDSYNIHDGFSYFCRFPKKIKKKWKWVQTRMRLGKTGDWGKYYW